MPGQANIRVQTSVAGVSVQSEIIRQDEIQQSIEVELAAGIAGELTTRTSDTAGVFTVGSGHGVTTSNKISVFWDGGACYNCTVSATGATSITINAATGDVLPAAETDVIIGVEATHLFSLDGDTLKVLAVSCPNRSIIQIKETTSVELAYVMAAGEGRLWISEHDVTNPIVGDAIDNIVVSNGQTTAAVLLVGALLSST